MENFRKVSLQIEMGFRRHCRGCMMDWRKLVLVAFVLTTAAAVFQTHASPYPMTIWSLFPSGGVSSYKKLNGTILVNESLTPKAMLDQFPPISIAPVGLLNSTVSNISVSDVEKTSGVSQRGNSVHQRDEKVVFEQLSPIPSTPLILINSTISNQSVSDLEKNGVSQEEKPDHDGEESLVLEQFVHNASLSLMNSSFSNLTNSVVEGTSGVSHQENPDHERAENVKKEKLNIPPVVGHPPATGFTSRNVTHRPHRKKPMLSMLPHEALIYAKMEIESAPIVSDDPDLYASLFRNISVFKRSYNLMERILKVYIYKDGARPIFHTPPLKGIYASEGWFMKLMEENKQFVVKDPNKAHLFYLPYSARQLEHTLYVPNSHDMRPLSLFLKEYVNMISAKYPFWNRTRGSDHFFVACHDWGPYTTKEHEELCKNAIKALCNADISEGIFVRGKDVSLPETSIRSPTKPLRDIGGKLVSQRSILAFFAGKMHGRVRPILLKYWEGKDEDMKIYGPLPRSISRKMSYSQHMKSSKFCICPMGYEVNSPRIVEAIYYECVPVIIADNFVLPFDEVLDWTAFSLVVAEKDIPNLKDILLKVPLRRYIYMQTNIKQLKKHFLWHSKPIKYDIFHMILHSIWFNRLKQIQIPLSNEIFF